MPACLPSQTPTKQLQREGTSCCAWGTKASYPRSDIFSHLTTAVNSLGSYQWPTQVSWKAVQRLTSPINMMPYRIADIIPLTGIIFLRHDSTALPVSCSKCWAPMTSVHDSCKQPHISTALTVLLTEPALLNASGLGILKQKEKKA